MKKSLLVIFSFIWVLGVCGVVVAEDKATMDNKGSVASDVAKSEKESVIPKYYIGKGAQLPLCNAVRMIMEEKVNKDYLLGKTSEMSIPKKYREFSKPSWEDSSVDELQSSISTKIREGKGLWKRKDFEQDKLDSADIYINQYLI